MKKTMYALIFSLLVPSIVFSSPVIIDEEEAETASILSIPAQVDFDVRLARSLFSSNASKSSLQDISEAVDISLLSIGRLSPSEIIPHEEVPFWTRKKKLKAVAASCLGVLAGAAMTPVYLDDLAYIFPSLQEESLFSDVVRYSTMALLMTDNITRNLPIALDEEKRISPKHHWLGKPVLLASASIPVIFLYNTEKAHALSAKEEGAFNPYMTVFYLGAFPLLANQYLQSSYYVSDLADDSPLTTKQKTFVYGLTASSLFAQGVVGYLIVSEAVKSLGGDEQTSQAIGIATGGVIMTVMNSLHQSHGFRKIVETRNNASSWIKLGLIHSVSSLKALPSTITAWKGVSSFPSGVNKVISAHILLSESLEQTGSHWLSFKKIKTLLKRNTNED